MQFGCAAKILPGFIELSKLEQGYSKISKNIRIIRGTADGFPKMFKGLRDHSQFVLGYGQTVEGIRIIRLILQRLQKMVNVGIGRLSIKEQNGLYPPQIPDDLIRTPLAVCGL